MKVTLQKQLGADSPVTNRMSAWPGAHDQLRYCDRTINCCITQKQAEEAVSQPKVGSANNAKA